MVFGFSSNTPSSGSKSTDEGLKAPAPASSAEEEETILKKACGDISPADEDDMVNVFNPETGKTVKRCVYNIFWALCFPFRIIGFVSYEAPRTLHRTVKYLT